MDLKCGEGYGFSPFRRGDEVRGWMGWSGLFTGAYNFFIPNCEYRMKEVGFCPYVNGFMPILALLCHLQYKEQFVGFRSRGTPCASSLRTFCPSL